MGESSGTSLTPLEHCKCSLGLASRHTALNGECSALVLSRAHGEDAAPLDQVVGIANPPLCGLEGLALHGGVVPVHPRAGEGLGSRESVVR